MSNKILWSILTGVVAIVLTLTGAWAVTVTDGQKELRSKDSQLQESIQQAKIEVAVQQEALKRIEQKLDLALTKLDALNK